MAILWVGLTPVMAAAQNRPPLFAISKEMTISGEIEDLSPIDRIAVAPDGGVVVWQLQDRQLRFFDAAGRARGKFGRPGEGPGEFRYLGPLAGWTGDSLWITDPSTRRVTVISPQLQLVRSVPWPTALRLGRDSLSLDPGLVPRAVFADGSILAPLSLPRGSVRPKWFPPNETRVPLVVVGARGDFERLVAWTNGPVGSRCDVRVVYANGGGVSFKTPFCAEPVVAIAPDGRRVLQLIPESPSAYRLVVQGSTGDTLVSRRYFRQALRIPARTVDSTRAAMVKLPWLHPMTAPEAREQVAAEVRKVPFPSVYPPFKRLMAGNDGTIWVEEWSSESSQTWLVYSEQGLLSGTVTLPGGSLVGAATKDAVWVLETDDDGVTSVVRYRLRGSR